MQGGNNGRSAEQIYSRLTITKRSLNLGKTGGLVARVFYRRRQIYPKSKGAVKIFFDIRAIMSEN